MAAIALLAAHHDPHGAPLRNVDGLDDAGNLVDKGDGARHVVERLDVADLLPRHGHVLQQLEHRVRHVLERAQVHALVMAELAVGHVAVVGDDLANVLGRQVLLLRVDKAELALLGVALGLQLLPLACCFVWLLGVVVVVLKTQKKYAGKRFGGFV